ncbi:2Fe-2S iron-sulfur cluster binding domain-containing protein [bacterium]|nr:2Fe-2S iron-sulfur cluster binding domain-containing protein [bacterium]
MLAVLLVIAERFLADYGDVKVSINDGEKELEIKGGQTLLASLNSEKIFLPSACGGRGTCAYCKCKVTDGAGQLLPTEEPLLTKEEIKQNMRLACQVKVKQDMVIEIPEELFNIKEFRSRVTFIKDLTHDIKLVRFELIEPNEINFKAGQYIQLWTKPYGDVKESVSRAYSMASPNREHNFVELMIRLVPEGMCTSWVHQHMLEGDPVKLVGPMGEFQLHEGDGEMIFVAGGSGMAPIAALLEEMVDKHIDRKAVYFFGAVTSKDLFYMDEMKAFEKKLPNFRFVPALSAPLPEDNWHGETGLITQPLINHIQERDNSQVQAYMCGSPGMIFACSKVLNSHGISSDRIFYDPFA